MRNLTSFLLITLAIGTSAQAQELSIGQIVLGMSKAQVQAKIGTGYKFRTVPASAQGGPNSLFAISKTNAKDRYTFMFLDDKLTLAEHEIIFAKADEVNAAETAKGLIPKFGGQPTRSVNTEGAAQWMVWLWEKSTNKLVSHNQYQPKYQYCDPSPGNQIRSWPQGDPPDFMSVPTVFSPDCGRAAYVGIGNDQENPQLANHFVILIENQAPVSVWIDNKDAAEKRRKDAEAAKAKKAPY